MRIAYLGQMADVASENGISKKIRQQVVAWTGEGHMVRYFALTPTARAWQGLAPIDCTLVQRGGMLARRSASLRLCRMIEEWKPNLIYFRYAHHEAGLPDLFSRIPCVAEINSDDSREYGLTLPLHKRLYHMVTRRRILRSTTALVPVTREIQERLAWLGRPSFVMANSLDFGGTPQLSPPPKDATASLVFVGSHGTPWHGLDRIGEIARILPEVTIHVIGCTLEDWPKSKTCPANITLHGHLPFTRYRELMQRACVAIGTMALFRKHMDEACPLKVREYLALGLPVMGAYQDTDIPEGADYFLRLPNNQEPLDAHRERMRDFIRAWSNARVPRASVAHMDVQAKERQRIAFMAQWCTDDQTSSRG